MNMDNAFVRCPEDDYYYILGCHESSSNEQILAEYKHRALQYHPDKNQDDSANLMFQKLQEAKEVLSDPSKRKDYDKWKTSGIMISYKQWLSMRASNCAFHWASPRSEGKMLPYETNNLQQAPTTAASQHSPSYTMRPHLTYNSILAKFRNYEI